MEGNNSVKLGVRQKLEQDLQIKPSLIDDIHYRCLRGHFEYNFKYNLQEILWEKQWRSKWQELIMVAYEALTTTQ